MVIKEITASLGRTLQFQQYQPHVFHVSMKAELEEKDDPQEAFKKLHLGCEVAIKEEIDKVKESFVKKKIPVKN